MSIFANKKKTISSAGSVTSITIDVTESEYIIGDSGSGSSGFQIILPSVSSSGNYKLREGQTFVITDENGFISGGGPILKSHPTDIANSLIIRINGINVLIFFQYH